MEVEIPQTPRPAGLEARCRRVDVSGSVGCSCCSQTGARRRHFKLPLHANHIASPPTAARHLPFQCDAVGTPASGTLPRMPPESYLLYALVVVCEVGFWVILLLALAVRYLLRKDALSRALLLCMPLIDAILLVFTALDLRLGAAATFAHGLAAAYVGFTIAFGGLAVKWVDAHFAHRFAAGPTPEKAPSRGWEAVRYEFNLWGRCIVACVITMTLVEALLHFVGTSEATQPLLAWHKHAFGCIVLWFIFGPVWSLATAWRRAN